MSSLPINGLDLTVGLVLLISALLAFLRGFVQETLSVGAWIGATFGALYGVRYVHPYAREIIPLDWAADAAATVVLFLLILFILSVATNMVARTVQRSSLNPLDRSLGFLFGVIRGAVILCVALIISDWLMKADDRPHWMKSAKTLPLLEDGAGVLKAMIPQSFQRAEDTAKDAAAKINEAAEMKRTLERLTAPTPSGAGDTAQDNAVKPDDVAAMKEALARLSGSAPGGSGDKATDMATLKRALEQLNASSAPAGVKDAASKINFNDPAEVKRALERLKASAPPETSDLIGQKMQELEAKSGSKR